jgi:hypothetical protein
MPTWQTADLAIAMDRSAYLNLDRGSSGLSSDGRKRGNTKTFAFSSDGSGKVFSAFEVVKIWLWPFVGIVHTGAASSASVATYNQDVPEELEG